MPKVNILGLGPGSKSYILPVTSALIAQSQVIIGAKRNLASLDFDTQEQIELNSNLSEIKEYIIQHKETKRIAVVVSGDTGFYSLLNYLKSFLTPAEINVVPGISSLQYLYARLGLSYNNAHFTSLHGRNNDFLTLIKNYESVGILTDQKSTPAAIAQVLYDNNLQDIYVHVGERLSYPDEKITRLTVSEALSYTTEKINVVVIAKE